MNTTTLASLAELLRAQGLLAGTSNLTAETGLTPVTGADCDSRVASAGHVFVCKGAAFRPAYLTGALDAGAVAYLCDEAHADELAETAPDAPALVATDLRRAMALVSAEAWGHPDRDVRVVGITGTKGKTTTAYMIQSIAQQELGGEACGLIGTVESYDGVTREPSKNTTPEAADLWRHLANARNSNLSTLVMEISSQALKYDRVLGMNLAIGCFLNIGIDHISPIEHSDFEDYFTSKLKMFKICNTAVVNLDSSYVDRILAAASTAPRLVTFGIEHPEATAWADEIEYQENGSAFTLHLEHQTCRIELPFPGEYSVSNALCAALTAHLLNFNFSSIVKGLALARVPGRMEFYRTDDRIITALVDFAHNKMSFNNLLPTISAAFRGAYLIAVFGAVGGKAIERRKELPEAAAKYVDYIILTSDDPWTEDPTQICLEMEEALPKGFPHEIIVDREAAINRAFAIAENQRSVVMLLAKGHETYQHTKNGYEPYPSDSLLAKRGVSEYDLRHTEINGG